MVQKVLFLGVLINLALIGIGPFYYPPYLAVAKEGALALAATAGILLLYGLCGWFGSRTDWRFDPRPLQHGDRFGLMTSVAFCLQIILPFALPLNFQGKAILETVLAVSAWFLIAVAGGYSAYQMKSTRRGLLVAVWASAIGILFLSMLTMGRFYLFSGTGQMAQMLQAKGVNDAFLKSGTQDLLAFAMQEIYSDIFYLLLISPFVSAFMGSIGGLVAWLVRAYQLLQIVRIHWQLNR